MSGDTMINEIMSRDIIYGNINDSIKDISKLMKEKNIGFIPIKDKDKFVGVITDRDICLAVVDIKSIDDKVKPYITSNIEAVDISANIDEALKIMSNKKIKRLLVKEKDSIVGILSLSDILEFTNNPNILSTYKSIFYIGDNTSSLESEIDEFYL